MIATSRPPDWSHWAKQKQAKAWECLALSVDIEPRSLGLDHFLVLRASQGSMPLLSEQDPEWLKTLCERLGVLLKVLENAPKGLRAGRGKAVDLEADLKLDGFAVWAKSKRWALPKRLRERAAASDSSK